MPALSTWPACASAAIASATAIGSMATVPSSLGLGMRAFDVDAFRLQDVDHINRTIVRVFAIDSDGLDPAALVVQEALAVHPIRSIGNPGNRLPVQGGANPDADDGNELKNPFLHQFVAELDGEPLSHFVERLLIELMPIRVSGKA